MDTNLVLIGMPASGKSRVGKLLSKRLEMPLYDSDEELEKALKKPLQDIITAEGWEAFRQKESLMYEVLGETTGSIICTGGGAVLQKKNIDVLRKNGILIFLNTPIPEIIFRLTHSKKTHRPQFAEKDVPEKVRNIWRERKELYYASADIILHTIRMSADKQRNTELHVEKLLQMLKKRGFFSEKKYSVNTAQEKSSVSEN